MTRGTSRGEPKRIPITDTDLGIRIAAARALLNHLLRTNQLDALEGYNLNLNYPSLVGTMEVAGDQVPYGYSSGIYVKHAAAATPVTTAEYSSAIWPITSARMVSAATRIRNASRPIRCRSAPIRCPTGGSTSATASRSRPPAGCCPIPGPSPRRMPAWSS